MQIWLVGKSKSRTRKLDAPRSSCGFTLLELIVVLTIVGIALSLTLPSIGKGLRHWRLQEAVREVATLMKFSRNQSVATRRPLQVVLDRSQGMYWLDSANARSDPQRASEKGIRLYALPSGIHFGEVILDGRPVNQEQVGIFFFPPGSSSGGKVQIVDEDGKGYHIILNTVTGQTAIARLPG